MTVTRTFNAQQHYPCALQQTSAIARTCLTTFSTGSIVFSKFTLSCSVNMPVHVHVSAANPAAVETDCRDIIVDDAGYYVIP